MDKGQFLKIYLNPKYTLDKVLKLLGISKATLYRKVSEYQIKTYRVGILAEKELPPSSKVYWDHFDRGELCPAVAHHVELAIHLAKAMNSRLEVRFLPGKHIRRKILNSQLDFGLNDVTHLPSLKQDYDFSTAYLFLSRPKGVLFARKDWVYEGKKNLKIGVNRDSLHQKMGKVLLPKTYNFIPFAYQKDLIRAFYEGKVDLILDHPSYFPDQDKNFQTFGDVLHYGGETAIPVKPGNSDLLNELNAALAILKEGGTLQALEKKYIGLDQFFI